MTPKLSSPMRRNTRLPMSHQPLAGISVGTRAPRPRPPAAAASVGDSRLSEEVGDSGGTPAAGGGVAFMDEAPAVRRARARP